MLQKNALTDDFAPHPLRAGLDRLYMVSGILSGAALAVLFLVVMTEIVLRLVGSGLPGSTSYAGYLVISSAFLGMAYTLNSSAHVRVGLLLDNLSGWRLRLAMIVCLAFATAFSTALAWYSLVAVQESYVFHDISTGRDATPLWLAQAPMAAGAVVFAICCLDNLIAHILYGRDHVRPPEAQLTSPAAVDADGPADLPRGAGHE